MSAFLLAASTFFEELERDEEFVSKNFELGLGRELDLKSEIKAATSKGDTEDLRDLQELYLEKSELLAPDLLAELNRHVKQASGIDFSEYNDDFLLSVENILSRGTISSAEEYRHLERYLDRLRYWDRQSDRDREPVVDSLLDRYFDVFGNEKPDSEIIKRGEKILARGTIRSTEEFIELSDYRDYLIDKPEPGKREWDAEELLGKYAEEFDKPL